MTTTQTTDLSSRKRSPSAPTGSAVLIDAFCEFHAKVIHVKRLVTSSPAPPPPDAVMQRLLDNFESQALTVTSRLAEHELRVFEEVRYVMVAMADEIFLRLAWEGREAWADKPLEAHVFQSHDSGERFFNRLDDILDNRAAASTELLTVYLTALALGFRGRYALPSFTEPETYRRRLAEHLSRVDPQITAPQRELCEGAHEHTLEDVQRKTLPRLTKGLIPLLIVFAGWIFIAQIFWYYRTSTVNDALDRIEGVK